MKKITYLFLAIGLFLISCEKEDKNQEVLGEPVITSISPEKGFPLSTVTIEGQNFSRTRLNNNVQINGVDARIIHFNEHTIHIEVPETGVTGPISVTVGGRSVTGPTFTYMDPPAIYNVETYAGVGGTSGYSDGDRLTATFFNPEGVEFDSQGNLIIADRLNHVIRKITPGGQVSLVAGVPNSTGTNDGSATTARFNSPWRITIDAQDNIYVADRSNHRIRKIDAQTNMVTTVAGSSAGFGDGVGTAARFNRPLDVVAAADGTLYVADEQNNRIRKIAPDGTVTTLAGSNSRSFADGTGAEAAFNVPCGVDIDHSGNIIVADRGNHAMRKITPAGVTTTIAGTPGEGGFTDGLALEAKFNGIYGVTVASDGSIYIAEIGPNNAIRKMTPTGELYTIGGNGTAGLVNGSPASATQFRVPTDVAIDSEGRVYIADMENHVIRRLIRTN